MSRISTFIFLKLFKRFSLLRGGEGALYIGLCCTIWCSLQTPTISLASPLSSRPSSWLRVCSQNLLPPTPPQTQNTLFSPCDGFCLFSSLISLFILRCPFLWEIFSDWTKSKTLIGLFTHFPSNYYCDFTFLCPSLSLNCKLLEDRNCC